MLGCLQARASLHSSKAVVGNGWSQGEAAPDGCSHHHQPGFLHLRLGSLLHHSLPLLVVQPPVAENYLLWPLRVNCRVAIAAKVTRS